jgi:hypothetical protein
MPSLLPISILKYLKYHNNVIVKINLHLFYLFSSKYTKSNKKSNIIKQNTKNIPRWWIEYAQKRKKCTKQKCETFLCRTLLHKKKTQHEL